jgi:UDPglucose 6-dehydrogenase
MIQDGAEKLGNINAEVVCDALSGSTKRIMGPSYMKPGMGDGGACHPRDNIALRYLAQSLDLGYDLFDAVMKSREVQAKNMAEFLIKQASNQLPIVIIGKAYKPLVPYEAGSSSMLVGHYVEALGGGGVNYII